MAAQDRRGGCGCCGFLFSFLLFLLVLLLVAAGLFYFKAADQVNRFASTGPVPLPPSVASRQVYNVGRQRFEHFSADSGERSLTLSNAELNSILADAPELRFLNRGLAVTLNQNSAEVYCSLPVSLPFVSRKYFNCTMHLQPSMRGDEFQLNVSRIDRQGKVLGAAELRQFQLVAAPSIERMMSLWNKLQMDLAVRDVRIENGNLVLAR